MKKYNTSHDSIVDSWRTIIKNAGVDSSRYINEALYNVIMYWYGVVDKAGDDVQEQMVINDVKNNVKR
jgi:hypothetical protein